MYNLKMKIDFSIQPILSKIRNPLIVGSKDSTNRIADAQLEKWNERWWTMNDSILGDIVTISGDYLYTLGTR